MVREYGYEYDATLNNEVFFASDTIIGIKKEKNKQKQHDRTRKNNIKQRKCIDFYDR